MLHADCGIGRGIRTTYSLARQHDVEAVAVLGHPDEPVFRCPMGPAHPIAAAPQAADFLTTMVRWEAP